jgi:fibronectin-binding autotransporter adhesin
MNRSLLVFAVLVLAAASAGAAGRGSFGGGHSSGGGHSGGFVARGGGGGYASRGGGGFVARGGSSGGVHFAGGGASRAAGRPSFFAARQGSGVVSRGGAARGSALFAPARRGSAAFSGVRRVVSSSSGRGIGGAASRAAGGFRHGLDPNSAHPEYGKPGALIRSEGLAPVYSDPGNSSAFGPDGGGFIGEALPSAPMGGLSGNGVTSNSPAAPRPGFDPSF